MLLAVLQETQQGCGQIAVVNFKFRFVEAVSSLLASADVSYFSV